jgi:sugar/nucleoside kinase (ribokinase family)
VRPPAPEADATSSTPSTVGRVVLVGSVIVDLVLRVPALPSRGGDVLAASARHVVGGGYYVLSSAAAGGAATVYLGRHGAGPFGARVRDAVSDLGTVVALPADPSRDTGVCIVLVEPDGERTFVTSAGVEATITADDLAAVDIRGTDIVYVSGYDLAYDTAGPAIADWVGTLPTGAVLAVDPGPLVASIPDRVLDPVLRRTGVLTLNRRERALLAGRDDAALAADALRRRVAANGLIVLRDGAAGCEISGADLRHRLVRVPVEAVAAADTTGAGDVHTGSLLAALLGGSDPVIACRLANAAASRHLSAS